MKDTDTDGISYKSSSSLIHVITQFEILRKIWNNKDMELIAYVCLFPGESGNELVYLHHNISHNFNHNISRPARKQTLGTLRKVSTRIR